MGAELATAQAELEAARRGVAAQLEVGDIGRYREIRGGTGRSKEIQGDTGRSREI